VRGKTRENIAIIGSLGLSILLAIVAIHFMSVNRSSLSFLNDQSKYLQMLRDPSLKADGTSYVGTPFFNFRLADLNGVSYQLSYIRALFKMIIVFDLHDCNSCLNEYRLWETVYGRYPKDKIAVIGICMSREEGELASFIKARQIVFPILWDPEKTVKARMRLRQTPIRVLLDQNDIILEMEGTLTTVEHQQYFLSMLDSMVKSASETFNK
jgi:peroxiredoxin